MNLDAVMDYLNFVQQRHAVWEHRQAGDPQPWTDDPIVAERKFTNVYRVLDYGSQYALRELLELDLSPRETLARVFLYRHTGRPEVWDYYRLMHGEFPRIGDFSQALETWKQYRGGTSTITCGNSTRGGPSRKGTVFDRPVFTSAYLVFPQSQIKGTDKLESIVKLAARLFREDSREDIMPQFRAAHSQAGRFAVIQRNKGVGDFMALQVLTDWGYSQYGGDVEDEFVVAGPGSTKGARAVAPEWAPVKTINWAHRELGQLGLSVAMPDGGWRPPSLMDAQNTLCEFSKYVRYQSKPNTGKPYPQAHPGPQPTIYPIYWSQL